MKKKDLVIYTITDDVDIGIKEVYVDRDAYHYIHNLECELRLVKHEREMLKLELDAIKPVVKNVELEPAVSKHCEHCKYVVRSSFSGQVLKCRKNGVCTDFVPTESEV